MSKFKLTQTATEVQDILNNSLQKPTGLSKTELVGVGVNGQENIEIGDNLTLANGKLSSATGSLPSTIQFDAEGNRTASKDVKVDGKLKLKSLVSESNPDGDITKELGGGEGSVRHAYRIIVDTYCWFLSFTPKDYGYEIGKKTDIPSDFYTNANYKDLLSTGYHPAGGYYNGDSLDLIVSHVQISERNWIGGYRPSDKSTAESLFNIQGRIVKIVQLN